MNSNFCSFNFNLCALIGNICNGLLLGNASIARGLTHGKKLARHEASRKSWSTKFPLGEGGKPYLASGLQVQQLVTHRAKMKKKKKKKKKKKLKTILVTV